MKRLVGAVVGFVGGVVVGVGVMFWIYGNNLEAVGWPMRITAALVVGAIDALLGSLSGLSKGS